MKASDIKNKALAEILAFAVFELTNIINHRIAIGNAYKNKEGDYEESVCMYDMPTVTYDEWYETPKGFKSEEQTLRSFILRDDAVYVTNEETEFTGNPAICLRSLDFDSIVKLTDTLETMWNQHFNIILHHE